MYDPTKTTIDVPSHIPRQFCYTDEPPNTTGPPGSLPTSFTRKIDYAGQISRLNKVAAFVYCDTLDYLSKPSQNIQEGLVPRIDYLQASLHNVVHLTNLLRDAQSRASVLGFMKKQIGEMNQKAQRLERLSEASAAFLQDAGVVVKEPPSPTPLREGVVESSVERSVEILKTANQDQVLDQSEDKAVDEKTQDALGGRAKDRDLPTNSFSNDSEDEWI